VPFRAGDVIMDYWIISPPSKVSDPADAGEVPFRAGDVIMDYWTFITPHILSASSQPFGRL